VVERFAVNCADEADQGAGLLKNAGILLANVE